MGGTFSKREPGKKTRNDETPPSEQPNYDDDSLNRLRRDLMEKPEKFLLNHILMSVQFYENFDREMQEFRMNRVSEREIELNRALAGHQKHCVLPDTVTENVNKRVRFRPVHGPEKLASEPLLPQRMFIVHDNIEVLAEGETDEYSTVDGPVHRAISEFADREGYIKLRQMEFLNVNGQNGIVDSDSKEEKDKTITFNVPSTLQNGYPVQNGSIPDSPMQRSPILRQTSQDTDSSTPPQTPSAKQRIFEKRDSALSTPTNKDKSFFQELNSEGTRRFSETRKASLKDRIFRSRSMSFKNSSAQKLKKTNSAENINKPSTSASPDLDSNYDYTTVRRLTEPKPLSDVRANRNLADMSSIPSQCITEIKVKKLWTDEVSDDDEPVKENGRRRPPPIKKKKELFEIKRYFNSVEFFKHFGDVFESIHSILGFSAEACANAVTHGGAVHCTVKVTDDHKIYYEVIPTISSTWPPIALEWSLRKRPVITNLFTNVRYQWPTKNMITKITKLNANIFPLGFLPKRGVNECHPLEWSLSFPAAERFMFACMSHSQVRCFFFILALYKTFLVPSNTELGLAPHHIRTVMFWECENNYLTWPEDQLGTKMLNVLQSLYRYLMAGRLPDYFVKERNLFETCLSQNLRYSQAKLNQIKERPVVYVLSALRNLRYTSGSFFPTLDFKTLYKIITESSENLLTFVNPVLSSMVQSNTEKVEYEEPNEFEENQMSFWSREKKRDQQQEWKKKRLKQIEQERKEKQKLKKSRRDSVDSIDLQLTVPELDMLKRGVLVKFFIKHFIEVSKKCIDYEAFEDATVLLNHCRYLAILLDENQSFKAEARQHQEKIAGFLDQCEHMRKQFEANRQNTLNTKHLPAEALKKKKKSRPGNMKFVADINGQENKIPKRVVFENGEGLNESSL